jgi:hypothetical protein
MIAADGELSHAETIRTTKQRGLSPTRNRPTLCYRQNLGLAGSILKLGKRKFVVKRHNTNYFIIMVM